MLSVLVCHGNSTDGGFCCAAKQTRRSYGHACLLDKHGDSTGHRCDFGSLWRFEHAMEMYACWIAMETALMVGGAVLPSRFG